MLAIYISVQLALNSTYSGDFSSFANSSIALMLGIALTGAVSFNLLPISPLPQVEFPTLHVSANLPVPTLGGSWRWVPAGHSDWRVAADAGWFKANSGGIDGDVWFGRLGVEEAPGRAREEERIRTARVERGPRVGAPRIPRWKGRGGVKVGLAGPPSR